MDRPELWDMETPGEVGEIGLTWAHYGSPYFSSRVFPDKQRSSCSQVGTDPPPGVSLPPPVGSLQGQTLPCLLDDVAAVAGPYSRERKGLWECLSAVLSCRP